MGNGPSSLEADQDGIPSLDQLGGKLTHTTRLPHQGTLNPAPAADTNLSPAAGYYRPAVGHKNELATKVQWLSQRVGEQADKMEGALQKQALDRVSHGAVSA